MAKEIKEVKAAKPAKATKTPNPESFFNKFAKPVGKLGLVGALTAGAIGFVNELTKDAIATNIYNQKVEAYLSTGNELSGWTFNGEQKEEANYGLYGEADADFGIFDLAEVSEKMPSTSFIQEMMVYCKSSTGSDCNADSSDKAGFGFMAIGNHEGYGEMKMLITTDVDGNIKGWEQLGFITSFGAQTTKTLEAMDGLVNKPLNGSSFISGASTGFTNTGITSMLNEMKLIYDEVAVDPVVSSTDWVNAATTTGSIDGTSLIARINEPTTVFGGAGENNQVQAAKFADGSFMFIIKWTNTAHGNTVLFDVDASGTFEWVLVGDTDFGSYGNYGHTAVVNWLNTNSTVDFGSIPEFADISSGATTGSGYYLTKKAANQLATDTAAIWTSKGGTE